MTTYTGFQVNKGKHKTTLAAVVDAVREFKINTAQIFVANSRTNKLSKIGDHADIKKFVKKSGIKLYVHTGYPTTGCWGKTPDKGIAALLVQMKIGKAIGASGTVLHLPKNTPEHVVARLKLHSEAINATKQRLLLECPVFKPTPNESYEMPGKLNRLTKLMKKSGIKKWGHCIDTAHLWGSISEDDFKDGYDISTYDGTTKWLSGLNKSTVKKIKLFHLNGSTLCHSSNKDTHAIPIFGEAIGEDYLPKDDRDKIWGWLLDNPEKMKTTESGLSAFVHFADALSIPKVIERNRGSDASLAKSMSIINNI